MIRAWSIHARYIHSEQRPCGLFRDACALVRAVDHTRDDVAMVHKMTGIAPPVVVHVPGRTKQDFDGHSNGSSKHLHDTFRNRYPIFLKDYQPKHLPRNEKRRLVVSMSHYLLFLFSIPVLIRKIGRANAAPHGSRSPREVPSSSSCSCTSA